MIVIGLPITVSCISKILPFKASIICQKIQFTYIMTKLSCNYEYHPHAVTFYGKGQISNFINIKYMCKNN